MQGDQIRNIVCHLSILRAVLLLLCLLLSSKVIVCVPSFFLLSLCAMRRAHRRPWFCSLRFVVLASFWKLQNVRKSFEASVRYYLFTGSSLPAFCRFVSKIFETEAMGVPKYRWNHPKWDPRVLQATFCKRVGFKIKEDTNKTKRLSTCWCRLVIWGAIWGRMRFWLGVPKWYFLK